MATSGGADYKWTKDSTLVVVEFVDKEAIGIVNEGYKEPHGQEKVGIINLKCSGKLCVNKDDPLCKGEFVVKPKDKSGKNPHIIIIPRVLYNYTMNSLSY